MANGRRRGPPRIRIDRETKIRWFLRGAYALGKAFPRAAGLGYCCPLCVRAGQSIDLFTAEDVPLRKIGGRPLVLTCAGCNNRSGGTLDLHLGNLADVHDLFGGELTDPLRAVIKHGNLRIKVEATRRDGTLTLVVVKGNPKNERLAKEFAKVLVSGATFQLTAGQPVRVGRARLSVLRAAYLAAFSLLGYPALPYLARIRRQIEQPRSIDSALLWLVRHEASQPNDRRHIGFIDAAGAKAIYVGLGRWTALLPTAPDSALYDESPSGGRNFVGEVIVLPSEPTFGLSAEECAIADAALDSAV